MSPFPRISLNTQKVNHSQLIGHRAINFSYTLTVIFAMFASKQKNSVPYHFVPERGFPNLVPGTRLGFPNNSPVPIYTPGWIERGTARVKCLAQEHNTMSSARARTRTARSEVERTNHEATLPPTGEWRVVLHIRKGGKSLTRCLDQAAHEGLWCYVTLLTESSAQCCTASWDLPGLNHHSYSDRTEVEPKPPPKQSLSAS